MKIKVKEHHAVDILALNAGDVFIYKGMYYMVTDSYTEIGQRRYVCLDTGKCELIHDKQVIPCNNATLLVDY